MVTRQGTPPILKYTLKGEHGWNGTVFIDDEAGDIVVEFDGRQFFGHFWRLNKETLRQFLVSVNPGYIKDKFSYGRERWCGKTAESNLHALLEKTFGHPDDWPTEIIEMQEEIGSDMSKDAFHARLFFCDEFTSKCVDYHEESFGSIGANKEVIHFVDMFWQPLVEFWKNEILTDK